MNSLLDKLDIDLSKIAGLLFVVALLIISAGASALNGLKEAERRRRRREMVESAIRSRQAGVMLPPPGTSTPPFAPPPRTSPRGQQRKRPVQRPAILEPIPLEPALKKTLPASEQTIRRASPTAPPVAPPRAIADAASIRRWLSPATLRQQYILTELLQPPVSLRDGHLSSH